MDSGQQLERADGNNSLRAFVTDALARRVRRYELEHIGDLDIEDAEIADVFGELMRIARRLVDLVEQKTTIQDTVKSMGPLSDPPSAMPTSSSRGETTQTAESDHGASPNHHPSQISPIVGISQRTTSLEASVLRPATQNISWSNPGPDIGIPYREENGVIVLRPENMDQCRDLPLLLAQAEKLGAPQTGAFKFVLPDDYNVDIQRFHGHRESVSTFASKRHEVGVFNIYRNITSGYMEVDDHPPESMDVEFLAAEIERLLGDPERLTKMRYCTDQPARTPKDRLELGFPAESPIWPLSDNQLDLTKYVIPGLHWPYEYSSNQHGGLFTLHQEDGHADSLNCLYSGEKLWTTVAKSHSRLIEEDVKRGTCAQKVRHAARYYTRSKLDSLGASYTSFIQRPREVVFVYGRIYHQGGTIGSTRAEAVNYAPPGWTIQGYQECKETCGGFPIPNRFMEFRARGEKQLEQGDDVCRSGHVKHDPRSTKRSTETLRSLDKQRGHGNFRSKRRKLSSTNLPVSSRKKEKRIGDVLQSERMSKNIKLSIASEELRQIENQIRQVDKQCKFPAFDGEHPPSVEVFKLVAAIWSRPAITQFCSLVRSRRDLDAIRLEMNLAGDVLTRIERRVRNISISDRRSMLERFLVRLNQFYLAQDIENSKDGRIRADTVVIKQILSRFGWKRATLDHHRRRGNKWRRICGPYDGLLCFIFLEAQNPFGISPESYLHLQDADLPLFHRLLEDSYTKSICTAGKAFQKSLNSTAEDVEFSWESGEASLDKVPEEDLLSFLKPFPSIPEDIYDPTEYPCWPKPGGWPVEWPWPADPTSLPDIHERQCDFCLGTACTCNIIIDKARPRIKEYGLKGRGLQAIASKAGQVAYKQGEIIGQLTGKIVPSNSYSDGWSLELVRADISEEPVVCQIHCADTGNYFRLMNHSCKAAARFRGMRVSGKYRVMVEAVRDIRDGEEITVFYGKDYLAGRKCLCEKHEAEKHARATE